MTQINWIFTGSSVSGDGYGYAILRSEDGSYAVRLRFHQRAEIVPVSSYADCHNLGQAFCNVCRMWRNVQAREHALAQGFAVLG